MSDTVDRLINEQLRLDPRLRHAYHNVPVTHHQVDWAREMLERVERAMQSAGVPWDAAQRVLQDTVSGLEAPPDPDAEKLRRERDLLLTRFEPSEFGAPSTPVFTEPAETFSLEDDLTDPRERPGSSEEKSA